MIKNTLKTTYKNIIELMAISDIPENSRPENITLQQFCHLTDAIDKSRTNLTAQLCCIYVLL